MIEVEKKFNLSEEEISHLVDGADFLNERVFTDIYYDTKDYILTKQNKWLRSRDGKFELKVPTVLKYGSNIDQFDEINNVEKIKEVLSFDELDKEKNIRENILLSQESNLTDDLLMAGYKPFCVCKTTRRKYQKDKFIIDLDIVDYTEFTYNIGEIELMVKDESEIEDAVGKIMAFAKKNNLKIAPVRGKVIEYLKRFKPKHFDALVKSSVVESVEP